MTLAYEEQARLATAQPEFRDRICAGSFAAAVAAYAAVANPNPVKQAQRMALVNAVIHDPKSSVQTFAWVVVALADVSTAAEITDALILSTIGTVFDGVAGQLFPGAS